MGSKFPSNWSEKGNVKGSKSPGQMSTHQPLRRRKKFYTVPGKTLVLCGNVAMLSRVFLCSGIHCKVCWPTLKLHVKAGCKCSCYVSFAKCSFPNPSCYSAKPLSSLCKDAHQWLSGISWVVTTKEPERHACSQSTCIMGTKPAALCLMLNNCGDGVKEPWCGILGIEYVKAVLTFYELDMVKVNFSNDSSRCLVKSGSIMTGRAKCSSEREEEKHPQPGHWALAEDSFQVIPISMGVIYCF